MRKFGLIGYPLTHSFSKKYFEEKFRRENIAGCSYELFELKSIEQLPLLKAIPELAGLNVTIPYKESVLPFIDSFSPDASTIGAVNCIRVSNNKLEGHNTDSYGFEVSLKGFLTSTPEQAFILGTGGSSKAVEFVLKKMEIPLVKVSRQKTDGAIAYSGIEGRMKSVNLFVNTTPAGMFPNIEAAPEIPYQLLSGSDYLFDLIYNPAETELLKRGREKGARVKNGLEMLELQAEKSWKIWNG